MSGLIFFKGGGQAFVAVVVYHMRDFWGSFRLFVGMFCGDTRRADRGDYLCKSFGWENCCSGFTGSGTAVCSVRLLSECGIFHRFAICVFAEKRRLPRPSAMRSPQ